MEIMFLGQAGLFIKTRQGSVLCDPWFNPAYFASWFPFPSNENVDHTKINKPDYLYISHLHCDHFDSDYLRDHIWKEATVLLPDYPLDLLERALREIGFTKFIKTKNCQIVERDGLRFMIMALVAPNDGAIGDSSLIVDDGETRILNQNDSRPVDLDLLSSFGPYDAHFLQYSGATWYPHVYRFPEKMRQVLGRKKRENALARGMRYIQQFGASFVFPSSGPPCFLDDHLFHLNDFDRDPSNAYPDQTVFMELLQEYGIHNGRLMIPGSVATFSKGSCTVVHPLPHDEVQAIFRDKRAYLEAYKAHKQPLINAIKDTWVSGQVNILSSLKEWFEPLLEMAPLTCAAVNGRVLLDCGEPQVVIDFQQCRVYPWNGEEWLYRFYVAPALVESCIIRHTEDWLNEIFQSCRYQTERKGPYNEYLYNFFMCLSPERLSYAESYYMQQSHVDELWESDGYRIQRRCPHRRADLKRFARIENGILTCTMHGWQFELATGRCLTAEGHRLYTQPLAEGTVLVDTEEESGHVKHNGSNGATGFPDDAAQFIRKQCNDCWYQPVNPLNASGSHRQPEATKP